jgi:hypothetical protein
LLGYRPELERSRGGERALSGADRVWTGRTHTLYASHRNVGKIRHKGLLFSIGLVEDKESRVAATNEKVAKVTSSCEERGLIVGEKGGTVAGFNNVVALAPQLIAVSVLASLWVLFEIANIAWSRYGDCRSTRTGGSNRGPGLRRLRRDRLHAVA